MKQLANRGERTERRLAAIEAAIMALNNDDLLDLADIFEAKPENPLKDITTAEMQKRGISL